MKQIDGEGITVINFFNDFFPIHLKSDLVGEKPVYIFFDKAHQNAAFSGNLSKLMKFLKEQRKIEICPRGLSFILQSGVIPPPATIFKNLHIITCGWTAVLKKANSAVELSFEYSFPFFREKRNRPISSLWSTSELLEKVFHTIKNRLNENTETFLFHSSGKDSNILALALAEAGYNNRVTLITQQTNNSADESEISRQLAKTMGFKHVTVPQPREVNQSLLTTIQNHFTHSSFPWTDFVSLAYPIIFTNVPEIIHSNVIDGLGNDIYMQCLPGKNEKLLRPFFPIINRLRPFMNKLPSETHANPLCRTPAEWAAKEVGLLFYDSKKIYPESIDVFSFWRDQFSYWQTMDPVDFKTELYGNITIAEVMIRKVRNAVEVWEANLALPWADSELAEYFSSVPESYLTDRENCRNKLPLRDILLNKIGLDSDKIGKKGFAFDFFGLISLMPKNAINEIVTCKYWDRKSTEKYLQRLFSIANSNSIFKQRAQTIIHRLFLVSSWLNWCKYLNHA